VDTSNVFEDQAARIAARNLVERALRQVAELADSLAQLELLAQDMTPDDREVVLARLATIRSSLGGRDLTDLAAARLAELTSPQPVERVGP
jgi:hypothetical protein